MAKQKTMTVNRLHKILSKLIADGEGRREILVHKLTFNDPCEGDGCVMLPIAGCGVESIYIVDDDGCVATNKDGSERHQRSAVLYGNDYDPSKSFVEQ